MSWRRNKAPQNAAMQIAELVKLEREEQDQESHQLDQNLGYLQSAPIELVDDADRYKLDTETASEEDLIEAKERMERLCKNKGLMARLPDNGQKMKDKLEEVKAGLENVLKKRNPGFYKNMDGKATTKSKTETVEKSKRKKSESDSLSKDKDTNSTAVNVEPSNDIENIDKDNDEEEEDAAKTEKRKSVIGVETEAEDIDAGKPETAVKLENKVEDNTETETEAAGKNEPETIGRATRKSKGKLIAAAVAVGVEDAVAEETVSKAETKKEPAKKACTNTPNTRSKK